MYKIFISILCMVLIVCLPLAVAQATKEVVKDVVSVSEFGGAGYTDLIINVNKYEPVVIVSSILEEQNIPIYAFLSAFPTEGVSLPRVQSVSVNIIGGNKSRVTGAVRYNKPSIYTWDDMGYITLKLKKIEKEEEIPDKIDLELKAKIRYEAEITSHLVGGREEKTLEEEPAVELDRILTEGKYIFFGGKGRIRSEKISGRSATFVLYNSEGYQVSKFSVSEGKESGSFGLVKGSTMPEDFVRVRVDEIVDRTQNSSKISIGGLDHEITPGREILDWKVTNINNEYIGLRKGKSITRIVKGGYDLNEGIYESLEKFNSYFGRRFKTNEFNSYKEGFNEFVRYLGDFEVKEISEGEKPVAKFNVGDASADGRIGTTRCKVEKILSDRVYIIDKNNKRHTLYLTTEIEKEREGYYTYGGQVRYSDTLSGEFCDDMLLLKSIDTKKKVRITLLSGKTRGYTETTFWLSLPIEKRAITLSPRAIDRQINSTTKLIKRLDKSITKLEKVVKTWRKICLAVTGAMLVLNLVKGLFGVGKLAEEIKEKAKEKTPEELAKETAEALEKYVDAGKSKCPGYDLLKGYTFSTKEPVYVWKDMPGVYFVCKEGKISEPIVNPILKDKDGKNVIWNAKEKRFVKYEGAGKGEFGSIRDTIVNGRKAIIIPLENPSGLTFIKRQYEKWKIDPKTASKALYAVVYNNEIEFWVLNGKVLDVGDPKIAKSKDEDESLTDDPLASYPKNDKIGNEIYKEIERKYLGKISAAQRRGEYLVKLDGRNYKIDATQKFGEIGEESCDKIMGETQCWFIYNACDPVICPPSRCNLDGKAKDIKNVIQSGLIGSTILCFPNLWKDGVIVPFCVAGWLAGMKNLRSIFQGYVACLTNAKVNGKTTGVCDKMKSIFLCQILWQEVMSIFSLERGILGLITRKTVGSASEGGVKGISGAVKESTRTVNWFANEYATNVFAIYKGRSMKQIGAEICKNAIGGKLPDIGKLIEEISEPEDPVQFTSWFEEHIYSPTRQESRYQVFYHIYAGNPKGERERIRYKVFLQSKGKPFLNIDEGELGPGEFADETIDKIGLSGYQEICVNINGVNKCGFGKTVSTSFALSKAHDWWMRKIGGLAPEITKKEQCIPSREGLTPGYVPMAAVERQCSISNPYLGLGSEMEKQWIPVGECGVENGKVLGKCWQKMDLRKYSELGESTSEEICKNQQGEWCVNTVCNITNTMFVYDSKEGHFECCYKGGKCVEKKEEEKKKDEVRKEEEGLFVLKEPVVAVEIEEEIVLSNIKNARTCKEAINILEKAEVDYGKKENLRSYSENFKMAVTISCLYRGDINKAFLYAHQVNPVNLVDRYTKEDHSYYVCISDFLKQYGYPNEETRCEEIINDEKYGEFSQVFVEFVDVYREYYVEGNKSLKPKLMAIFERLIKMVDGPLILKQEFEKGLERLKNES